ncbi:GNAT family N-acetyltransferase [Sphingomonas sp. AOB5]|uniref:GNAT family N-acetyltransferase n=1 Tax=Sphingomonas sp. AOB5 TaxID=3034017 RepID=UPI0023F8747A|nr:GNAT family N-acetyltransferase [Sphingomonas sp. AOB5]MDF7776523.1 GNAT family N-acetyltransferase [Sphingomonas sp. AOB5]
MTWDEVEAFISSNPTEFPIAPIGVIREVWERNPTIFWRIGAEDCERPGLYAQLPLNTMGASYLLSGRFSGLSPDPACIARPDEAPAAIYLWLAYMPRRWGTSLPAIAAILEETGPEAVPLFSRGATEHSSRLHDAMEFRVANTIYPNAPEWLRVILPERLIAPRSPVLSVKMVRNMEDMAQIYAIRGATYLAEQFCLVTEEFDGNDFCSTQFIGYVDGDPAGCIRLRYFAGFVKIERLAVRREYRKSRLAFKLAREAVAFARRKGYTVGYGHSREDLVPFWRMFGARLMEDRPPFHFADMAYREIVFDLGDLANDAIHLGVDPYVSIRPEGEWDRMGPLELSNLRPSREQLIKQHTKTIRGTVNA